MRKSSSIKKRLESIPITVSTLSSVFCVAGEMKPDNGEDSYYYAVRGKNSVVAALDGCGGIGSRRYQNFSGKTGAYVASRSVCGAVKKWFEETPDNVEALFGYISRALGVCEKFADKSGRIMGSLGKSFPTTAAIISVNGNAATCIWAGDSRCYMLDCDGLHQLTEDDVDGEDALSNITSDGVLTNVICSGVEFRLHKKVIMIDKPCVLFAASDGCFGYLNTPMEFEYLLTSTLMNSKNIQQWKDSLNGEILGFTGDDYTLCASLFGFGNFESIQQYFAPRNAFVKKTYIDSSEDVEVKWARYKGAYCAYLSKL